MVKRNNRNRVSDVDRLLNNQGEVARLVNEDIFNRDFEWNSASSNQDPLRIKGNAASEMLRQIQHPKQPYRYGGLNPENYDTPEGANAQQLAGILIKQKLQDPLILTGVGTAVLGSGLLGITANEAQNDSNGNILLNPVTSAAATAGIGGYIGSEVGRARYSNNLTNKLQAIDNSFPGSSPAFYSSGLKGIARDANRSRLAGAAVGVGAGLLLQSINDLRDKNSY